MTTYGYISGELVRKPATQIRTERNDLFKSVFGDDLNIASTSPEGNLIGAETERESLIWELIEAVHKSQWIDTASGSSLDNVAAYKGIGRLEAQYSTATLTLATVETGSDTNIVSGSQAQQSTTQTLWETLEEVDIPAATNVVNGTVTDIEFHSANTIRYTFSASISGVSVNDAFYMTGCTYPTNDGLKKVTAVGADYVDVENLNRSDDVADETSISIAGVITDGLITVSARTTIKGAFAASQGSVDTVSNPISGWEYVGNFAAAETGRDTETDAELRARAKATSSSSKGGTIEGIKARLLEVVGVSYAAVSENRTATTDGNGLPPHSIAVTLLGGDNQTIADLLYLIKGAGINTYGSVSVNAVDDYGVNQAIYFSRPTEIDIYYIVTVTTDANYPTDGDTQISDLMVTYGATLSNGDDVLNYKLIDAIASVPGILTIEIKQVLSDPPTLTANIAIANDEVAITTADNITVSS